MSENNNPVVRAQGTVDAMKKIGYNVAEGVEKDTKGRTRTPKEEKELVSIEALMAHVDQLVPLVEKYENAYQHDLHLFDAVDETMRVAAKTSIFTAHDVVKETSKMFSKSFPPVLQMVAMRHIKDNPLKTKSLAIKTARKTMEAAIKEWDGDTMAGYPEEMVSVFLSPWLDSAWEKVSE